MKPHIAVTSRSFSSNDNLRGKLLSYFDDVRFNDEGLKLEGDALVQFLEGAQGAIIGIEQVNPDVLSRLPRLRVISKFGVGLDTIDRCALDQYGIHLAHTQGTNSVAVAELSLMLMLAVLRRIPEAVTSVKEERWEGKPGRLLQGKKVGLIGVGNVGKALNELLRPFDCTVFGYDASPNGVKDIQFLSLDNLLLQADIVSIHVPLTTETRGLISFRELELLSPEAIIVNTSRGGVIDEAALLSHLIEGKLSGAGIDVFEVEPPLSWELAHHPRVFATPHIAGTSLESNIAMGQAAIDGLISNMDRLIG